MKDVCPGWTLVCYEVDEYAFFAYEKVKHQVQNTRLRQKKKRPTALVIRYGGFGDMLQTASFFPRLHEEFDIWVNTTPNGKHVFEGNPYVEGFWIQDAHQVPNEYLTTYWRALEGKFDRVINLSESIEGSLLAIPGRHNFHWSVQKRREKLGSISYLERMSSIAGLPFSTPDKGFYPSKSERDDAVQTRASFDGPVILWVLSGSSVHKAYPWTDSVVASILLKHPKAHVVFVGDALCEILELGWKNEPRVHGYSGKWGIRKTLAFTETVDVVIGPETGVLNFAGMLPGVVAIPMLSHSSPTNLTQHWHNAIVLQPDGVNCHPCHKLHYSPVTCNIHEDTGAALCMLNISPERVTKAIMTALSVRSTTPN
jgi:ADP-heptose:LPS heptosyltransferase